MKRLIREYKIEWIAALLVLVGLLMVADLAIRDTMLTALSKAGKTLMRFAGRVPEWVDGLAAAMSPGDFFGGMLIVVAVGFIIWRIRYRFQNDHRWSIDFCPKCSSPIMRVHRTLWDRMLGATFFPEARRYCCVNSQCNWSGLLRRHVHRHRSRSETASGSQNP